MEKIKRVFLIILGSFIVSVGINGLYIPNNILAGGVSGIAILLNIVFGCNASIVIILINIPIFIVGYKLINRSFIFYSFIGMISLSVFLQLTQGMVIHSDEMLTTLLLGGLLNGIGFGIILKINSSTGGSDIISKMLHKYFSYSVPTLNLVFNIIIIGLSVFAFGIDIAIQTLTTMYITAVTIKFILEGIHYKRTVFIITDYASEVGMAINTGLNRGCTIMDGKGSYTGQKRQLLYAIISIYQEENLRRIVSSIDEKALINVIETRVVFGNGKGFLNINNDQ